jgi:hypothetical protein
MKTPSLITVGALLGLATCSLTLADNPLVPNVGMADPHIHIYNNRAYLYATRDADRSAKSFVMPDWNIWSSADLVHWQHERTILPEETYMGKSTRCWAPDAATLNGNYYFYFSNGNTDAGVMVASDPAGPYRDALGKPLLPAGLVPTQEYDISVLVDNGVPYIAFGHYIAGNQGRKPSNYHLAKLKPNMISLAEMPKPIEIIGSFAGNDKPDITKHNSHYYLSAGANYAISDQLYGPYTSRRNQGDDTDKYGLNQRAHGKLFDWNHQSFFVWCRFIKYPIRYRESLMTYVHYRANGDLVYDRDFLDNHYATGVGQYDAAWDKIEAEWFMASEGNQKTESPHGGFEVSATKDGSWVAYPNVQDVPANSGMAFNCASANGGIIEVREASAGGPLLGTCVIPATGGWNDYQTIGCQLQNRAGTKKVVLVFKGNAPDTVHLDWFRFTSSAKK